MAELKEFRLPDVGEGLTEADIVAWHVKPGDQVEVNQIIVEIETAKAVVELPSPWDGTVVRLLAEEGQTIDVGVPIIAVDVSAAGPAGPGETDSAERSVVPAPAPAGRAAAGRAAAGRAAAGPAPAEQPERQPVLVGYGVKASATTRRARKAAPIAAAAATPAAPAAAAGPSAPPPAVTEPDAPAVRALAKPPVRRLAKDLGIKLAGLAGTGPDGTITREDVHRAASATTARSAEEISRRTGPGRPAWPRRPARPAKSASRYAGYASTWPRPWSPARSPRRTSPSSCRST